MKYAEFTKRLESRTLDEMPFPDGEVLYVKFAMATAALIRRRTEFGPRYDIRPGNAYTPERVWQRVQNKNAVPVAEPEAVARGAVTFRDGVIVHNENNEQRTPEAEGAVIGTNYAPYIPGLHEEAPTRHARRARDGSIDLFALDRMDIDSETLGGLRSRTERHLFRQDALSNLNHTQVMLALRGIAESRLDDEAYAQELEEADREFDEKIAAAGHEHRSLLKEIKERERSGPPRTSSPQMQAYHEYFSWPNRVRRAFGITRDGKDSGNAR